MKYLSILFLTFLISCGGGETEQEEETTSENEENQTEEPDNIEEEETPQEDEEGESLYTITSTTFFGVGIGDDISKLKKNNPQLLKESTVETGEGSFEVLQILNEDGEAIADIYPSPDDENIVGTIETSYEEAVSVDGIQIGNTFESIKKNFSDAVPHGSEIEGRVSVEIGGINYRLDANEYSYEIDLSKFNISSKVIAIIIN